MPFMSGFGRWSRGLVVSVLLGLSVITTSALAWEAWRSAQSAQATVDAVLGDYSTFAAWQFAREAQTRLERGLGNILDRARHDFDGRHGATRDPGSAFEECACAGGPALASTFEILGAGRHRVIGEALHPGAIAAAEALLNQNRAAGRYLEIVGPPEGDPVIVALQWAPGARPRVTGAVVPPSYVTELLAGVFASTPLLPEALIGDAPSRDVFSVRVATRAGHDLFTAGDVPSAHAGAASTSARLGGLDVHASIDESYASALVIGGLPADRWPIAAALVGLSTLLVVLATLQMRREVRFARRQADFVSGVSHELRTPLAQIRLYGETLLLGRVRSPEEGRRAAEVIVQEARRLGSLVDSVLLFSRMQHDRVTIDREPTDLGPLLEDVVESFRPFAAAKRATIALAVDTTLESPALDRNVCRQIVLNLLDNAIKYGPPGQTVRVRASAVPGGIELTVADEGRGVPADQRRRIWEPFWRAPGSAEGGSGLGLAIVRDLARRHGGTATVAAGPDRGARFVVMLRTDPPPEAAAVGATQTA